MNARRLFLAAFLAVAVASPAFTQFATQVVNTIVATTCTNQFLRSLAATGAGTCATVSLTADVTGVTPPANGGTGVANSVNLTVSSATSVGRGQYQGTNTNDAATAGNIGEYVENTQGTPQSLTSGNTSVIVSLTNLPAGDWDVTGVMFFTPAATTTVSYLIAGTSSTSSRDSTTGRENQNEFSAVTLNGGASWSISLPTVRWSLSSTTTINAVATASFGVSTMTSIGFIRARRVR